MIVSLGSARELQHLRASGRRVQSGPLTMIVSQDSDSSTTRVAYAVGRSVGTAVQRNRVRRRLRELLRHRDATSQMPASMYLFICRPLSTTLTFSQLADAVDRLLADAHPTADVTELTLT